MDYYQFVFVEEVKCCISNKYTQEGVVKNLYFLYINTTVRTEQIFKVEVYLTDPIQGRGFL